MEMPTKNMFYLGRPCISQAEVTFSLNVNSVILIDLVRMFLRDKNVIPIGIKFGILTAVSLAQKCTRLHQIVSQFLKKFPEVIPPDPDHGDFLDFFCLWCHQ